MESGRLREIVKLYRPVRTRDRVGQARVTYEYVRDDRAHVAPIRAREYVQGGDLHSRTTVYRLWMRYQDDIDSGWRIEWRGRTLDISRLINVDGRNRSLEILAHETEPQ